MIAMALELANQIGIPPLIDESRFSPKKMVPVETEKDKYPIDINAGVASELESLIKIESTSPSSAKPKVSQPVQQPQIVINHTGLQPLRFSVMFTRDCLPAILNQYSLMK